MSSPLDVPLFSVPDGAVELRTVIGFCSEVNLVQSPLMVQGGIRHRSLQSFTDWFLEQVRMIFLPLPELYPNVQNIPMCTKNMNLTGHGKVKTQCFCDLKNIYIYIKC